MKRSGGVTTTPKMGSAVLSPRMNFDLADLRAFVAVAKLASFRAAATESALWRFAIG